MKILSRIRSVAQTDSNWNKGPNSRIILYEAKITFERSIRTKNEF